MPSNSFTESATYAVSKLGAWHTRRAASPPPAGPFGRSLGKGEPDGSPVASLSLQTSDAAPRASCITAQQRQAALRLTFRVAARKGAPRSLNALETPKPKSRSGSQKRRRRHRIVVWCDDEEFALLNGKAQAAGLTRSTYGRTILSGMPVPRTRRAPAVNVVELAHATAALNKAGGNLNQISKAANSGINTHLSARQCEMVLEEIRAAAAAIRESAGYKKRQ